MWIDSIALLLNTLAAKLLRTPEQSAKAVETKERKRKLKAKKQARKYVKERLRHQL